MNVYTPRALDTHTERVAAVAEHARLTREAYNTLPETQRAAIEAELRTVSASEDTHVPRARRGSYGMTIRSGPVAAPHVVTARELLNRFTRVIPAPVDNSPAGRRARLLAARDESEARAALAGATIADMREMGGGWSTAWKRDRYVSHLVEWARIARVRRAIAAGDGETLRRDYDRARHAAAIIDGRPPVRTDMRALVETFRGRKLRTCKGTEWGTVSTFVNGHPVSVNATTYGSGPEGLARAAEQLRRDVVAADERRTTDPDAYPAEWFTGAPDADPAVIAYCRHAAQREAADREALAAPAPADDRAPAPVEPFPVGSTVESVHADPFPVRGTVAGYPAPGRVSIEWHGGNTQDMPVTAVRALTLKPNHQCRLCGRWLEGEWNAAAPDSRDRDDLQRQMDAGHCDVCPPRDQAPAPVVEAAPFTSGWAAEPFVSGWSALLDA